MKCRDCKHYEKLYGFQGDVRVPVADYCNFHEAILARDVVELDSAEKDCRGFEKR